MPASPTGVLLKGTTRAAGVLLGLLLTEPYPWASEEAFESSENDMDDDTAIKLAAATPAVLCNESWVSLCLGSPLVESIAVESPDPIESSATERVVTDDTCE